jgi:SSS family solute:Na+ symporter
LIVTFIALIYTALGGITAVIWTDVAQSAILFIGAFIIFFALLSNMPMSWGEALAGLQAEGKLRALDFSMDPGHVTTVWSGIIAMTLYHTTVYGTNQMMVQRTLAAKNIGDAKKSYLLMGFSAFFIYFLFIFMGVLFYAYYGGREFENGNTIILQFANDYGMPGLMGIIAAAVMAASMSSLDSAFNSLSTISTIDFYQKYVRKDQSPAHYLRVSRYFTVFWAVVIIIPAVMYSRTEGSILETLSQVGSFFVGAQLGMFALGFFSKHASEKGVLVGTGVGFLVVWYVATHSDIAWPWYCLIGATTNFTVSLVASLLLDGRQTEYSPYTVRGQILEFKATGRATKDQGWYRVPGKVDRVSYLLLVFFVAVMVFLYLFQSFIPGVDG